MKEFIRDRMLSFGMVLLIGFLLLVSIAASTALAGMSAHTERIFAMPGFVWTSINLVVALAVTTLLLVGIFKVLPDVHVPSRTLMAGATLTAVLFEIGKLPWPSTSAARAPARALARRGPSSCCGFITPARSCSSARR